MRAIAGLLSALCFFSAWLSEAWAEPPAVKLLSAPGVSPSSAWSYYGAATTHTTGVGAWTSGRPPELVALARTLGSDQLAASKISASAYTQNVFDYVRNNLDTEFRFGLAKGARGAVIDQSGTPFDQAHLMVELLRQGGVAANYQVGTITLSAEDFGKWTGLVYNLNETAQTFNVNAQAACQFLADGGIPVVIGSSSDCTTLSGNLSTITLGHVWVAASGNLYDPAFKRHNLRAGIDIAAAMGCGTSCGTTAKSSALSGAIQGTFAGAPMLQSINDPALFGQLQTWAVNLENSIENTRPDAGAEDIVGGQRIDFAFQPVIGASLPYTAAVNVIWTGDIPDQFRSRVNVDGGSQAVALFADDIEGGRLRIDQDPCPSGCGQSTQSLRWEGQFLANIPYPSGGTATLTLTLPYRVQGGVTQFAYPLGNGSIDIFWGNTGAGRISHLADLIRSRPLMYYGATEIVQQPCDDPPPAPPRDCHLPAELPSTTYYGAFHVEHEQAPLGGPTWYQAFIQAKRLVEGVSKSKVNLHFSVGSGSSYSLSYETAVSIASTTSDAPSAYAAYETLGTFEVMLEGAILQGNTEGWVPRSAIAGLVWAEQQGRKILDVASDTVTAVIPNLLGYDSFTTNLLNTHVSAGNRVIMSDFLGQTALSATPNCSSCQGIFMPTGGMFLVHRQGNTWIGAKGAGALGGPVNPLKAALESAERQNATRRGADISASLASGDATLAPAPDLVSGAGQFPYSLPFSRSYNSAHGAGITLGLWTFEVPWHSKSGGPDSESYGRLGAGWSHNYQISARLGLDVAAGLGDMRGVDAARVITAMHAFYDIHRTPDFAGRVTGIFAAHWSGLGMVDNAVTVTFPNGMKKFVRRADGVTFRSPLGGSEQLILTGAKTGPFRTGDGFYQESIELAYNYVGMQLTYRSADGSEMSFVPGHIRDTIVGSLGNGGVRYDLSRPYFVPATWTFADGMKVDFEYGWAEDGTRSAFVVTPPQEGGGGDPNAGYRTTSKYKVLTSVSNALGRSLTFGGLSLGDGAFRIDSVTDETGRSVTYSRSNCLPAPFYLVSGNYVANSAIGLECSTFEVVLSNGDRTIYAYTPAGYVPYVQDPYETWTPLAPSTRPNYRLRRIFTPSDNVTPFQTIQYDELMRVKSVTNVAGEKTDYLPGGVSAERWKRGQAIDPLGNVSTTVFDEDGAVIQSIDPLGRMIRNEYDDAGRLVRSIQPAGNKEERAYDVRSNVLTTCLIPKERWDQACDSSLGDIVTTTTYVEGPTVRTCANLRTCNQPTSTIDARGNVSNYSWNANGDLEQILLPADSGGQRPQTNYGYTTYSAGGASFRLLTSITEKKSPTENILSTFAYNASNRYVLQSGTVDPGGLNLTTTLAFDAIGNLTSVDGPRTDVGDITTYQWDALRRPVVVGAADPDGAGPLVAPRSIVKFDADGLVNFTASLKDNGEWRGVVMQHDTVGRPRKVTRPKTLNLGAISTPTQVAALALQTIAANDNYVETTYDAAGRPDIVADPENRQTKTVYDAASQVQKVIRAFGTSLQQDYQTNTYTPNGKLQSVASAKGFITRFSYDGFDRPTRTSWPDCASATDTSCAFSEIISYDKAGNVLFSRNRAGQTFSFSYDGLNRLTRKAAPDRVETYAYDLLGLQTCGQTWLGGSSAAACDPGTGSPETRTSQVWDKAKRLVSETQVTAGQSLTVGYQYADKVNRTGIVWPDGWRAVYSFDALNRLASVAADTDSNGSTETPLALYRYDALSQLAGVRRGVAAWGAGVSDTDLVWETDGDVDSVTHAFNGEAAGWIYDYDKSAKLISESRSVNFLYKPSIAQAISYSTGDPTSKTNKLDQYALVNAQAVTWDVNGNRASSNGLTTTHDSENRLIQASKGSMVVEYLYDAAGRRILKNFTSGPAEFVDTLFLNAGDMEIAEYCIPGQANCSGSGLLRRYVPGLKVDDRIAMIESNGAVSYYHPDRLGNVVAMTDASGQVTDRYKYTPFGIECGPNPTCTGPGSSGNVFRYTGRRFDPETGLYHYRARYYDPSEAGGGRFLETDPVGYADQMNLYAYVGNDPVNNTDPTGRCLVSPLPCPPPTPAEVVTKGGTHQQFMQASLNQAALNGVRATVDGANFAVDLTPAGDARAISEFAVQPSVSGGATVAIGAIPIAGDWINRGIRAIGRYAEDLAVKEIVKEGGEILGRNVELSTGTKADVLYRDSKGCIVDCEVKGGRTADTAPLSYRQQETKDALANGDVVTATGQTARDRGVEGLRVDRYEERRKKFDY